jgi:two-component system cell cycle sensor histidine kinase/response regulator CckA
MVPESVFNCSNEPEPDPGMIELEKEARDPDPLARFASGIAHDFNNLLTVINGYCELALSSQEDSTGLREYLQEILRAGTKAAEIVEMILTYSGQAMPSIAVFDGEGCLEEMRGLLGPSLGGSVSLNMRLCREACPIRGDRRQFRRAIMNLIMNAKDAMPDGGRIDVETHRIHECHPDGREPGADSTRLEIIVRDTGRGIAKEILGRIFDPYFSTKQCGNVPGRGLGLACTKGILRRLGGSISAESKQGAGTLFRIRLPIAEQP